MKFRYSLPLFILIAVPGDALCSASGHTVWAATVPQITFVQPTPAGQNPGRQTLPPDQKKSLPGIEPVFPAEREQRDQPAKPRATPPDSNKRKRPQAKPSPSPTAAPAAASTPAPPVPSPTAAAAAPSATPAPAAANRLQSIPPTAPPPTTDWRLPALGVLTFMVLGGLVFVLSKLRELLREGSS